MKRKIAGFLIKYQQMSGEELAQQRYQRFPGHVIIQKCIESKQSQFDEKQKTIDNQQNELAEMKKLLNQALEQVEQLKDKKE